MTCILATTDCIGVKFVTNHKAKITEAACVREGEAV